jgi:hypothetical protein
MKKKSHELYVWTRSTALTVWKKQLLLTKKGIGLLWLITHSCVL